MTVNAPVTPLPPGSTVGVARIQMDNGQQLFVNDGAIGSPGQSAVFLVGQPTALFGQTLDYTLAYLASTNTLALTVDGKTSSFVVGDTFTGLRIAARMDTGGSALSEGFVDFNDFAMTVSGGSTIAGSFSDADLDAIVPLAEDGVNRIVTNAVTADFNLGSVDWEITGDLAFGWDTAGGPPRTAPGSRVSFEVALVPEPTTAALSALGLGVLGLWRRRA